MKVCNHPRTGGPILLILIAAALCSLFGGASAATVGTGNFQILNVGDTITVPITLDTAPNGISGYKITVTLSDTSIAEITAVAFPAWATVMQSPTLPAGKATLGAMDLGRGVPLQATYVQLASLTVKGKGVGTADIAITTLANVGIQDRNGNIYPVTMSRGSVTVAPQPYLPFIPSYPTDRNGDGLYEDVNGNGRADFADVVLLFNHLAGIAGDDDWQYFDFNKNNRMDFADVVWLFNNLSAPAITPTATPTSTTIAPTTTTTTPTSTTIAPTTTTTTPTTTTVPATTPASIGETNAAIKALTYLKYMPFSRDGLIKQLEYEGFSHQEAVYGVDQSGADWNEQAAKKAAEYLKIMSFSRSGLIAQLEYVGFTTQQAEYGVQAVGY